MYYPLTEGYPRSILEAMSVGRPIITTNTTGCKETVLNGINGFLVPIKDTKSLVKAIQNMLMLDDEKINHMARYIKLARQKYDVRSESEYSQNYK